MAQVLTPSLQASSRVAVSRLRELPVPGKITVEIGDRVQSGDIVGRADLPGDLLILRVPEALGIEALEVINGLKVAVGDSVQEGDLLCEHAGLFGLFRSRFVSPATGVVELITERTGHIGIRQPSRQLSIQAYIDGKVVRIDEGKSVVIESEATFLQGIFGVGGERHGVLQVIAQPEDTLTETMIPGDCSGKILVGGKRPSSRVLQIASERGATGLVIGSIDDRALASYLGFDLGIALTGDEEVSMSLVITEGFGDLSMSSRSFSLIESRNGQRASLSGATQVRAGAVRPEVIIPLTDSGEILEEETLAAGLETGARVRLIRVPYFGKIAIVTEMPHQAERIPSGAFTRVLRARLEDSDQIVTVPRANVELLV